MNIVSIIMAIFAAIAAVDLIIGNKLGLGKEFEKGIHMMGELTLAMVGMIVLAPVFGALLQAPLNALYSIIPIDPSSFIGSLLACDMGGGQMSQELAVNKDVGYFNGLVVASMMGATVSFTLPFVMGTVNKMQIKKILKVEISKDRHCSCNACHKRVSAKEADKSYIADEMYDL
jgi:ethanolamine transporter